MRDSLTNILLRASGTAVVGWTMATVALAGLGVGIQPAYADSVPVRQRVDVARFAPSGDLIFPSNIDRWVFLGSSLGMGYSASPFDPKSPGAFHAVLIEPAAYDMFLKTGVFPDGAMFALVIYSSETNRSINRTGFVMGTVQNTEMHLKDSKKFPKAGFNFYAFPKGATRAAAAALPNGCVDCHTKHAAFDGVFTQFYPVLRDRTSVKSPK